MMMASLLSSDRTLHRAHCVGATEGVGGTGDGGVADEVCRGGGGGGGGEEALAVVDDGGVGGDGAGGGGGGEGDVARIVECVEPLLRGVFAAGWVGGGGAGVFEGDVFFALEKETS